MDPFWESTPIPCGPADACQAQSPSDLQIHGLVPKTPGSADPKAKQREGSLPLEIPHARLSPTSSQTRPRARGISCAHSSLSGFNFPSLPPHSCTPGACRGCQHPLETDFPHFHGISDPFPKARRISKGRTPMILPPASHSGSTAKFRSCHLPFPRRKAKFIPCLQLLRAQGNESSPGSCAGHSNTSPNK